VLKPKLIKGGNWEFYLGFLFFLLCPLLFNHFVLEPTNVPRFVVGSTLLLFAFFGIVEDKRVLTLPASPLVALLIGFYIIHLTSLFWSLNVADAIYESQKIFLGICGIIFFISQTTSENESNRLLKTVIASAAIMGVIETVEIAIYGYAYAPNMTQSLYLAGHKNLLSSALFLTIPFSVYGVYALKDKWKWLSIVGLVTSVLIIAVLQSRSVIAALILSVLCFGVMLLLHKMSKVIRQIIIALVLALSVSTVAIIFKMKVYDQKEHTANEFNASLVERYKLWDKSFQIIQDNPILGVGAGNWKYNYAYYKVDNIQAALYYNTVFCRPHNDFIWVFSETGIIGFSLLMLIIIYIGRHSLFRAIEEKNIRNLLIISGLVGLLIISFFSFPKERILHIGFTCILLSIVIVSTNKIRRITSVFASKIIALLIIGGLIGNIIVGWYRISGEYYTKQLLVEQRENNVRGVITNGYQAISPFYTTDPTGTPILSYIGWGYNGITQLDSLHTVSEAAYFLSPHDYKVLGNYGYILERKHYNQTARIILNEANRINPNYEPVIVNLSVLEFNNGNYNKSLDWLKQIENYDLKYQSNVQIIKEKLAAQ
jgi:O-antigen ligase